MIQTTVIRCGLLLAVVLLAACQGPETTEFVGGAGHSVYGDRPGPKGFHTVLIDAGHGGKDSGARGRIRGMPEKAVALGIDGIWVSNHGGRQIEAVAPSIDCLPGIVSAVGKKATILLDSGIRSGQDVMRSLALGADAAFAGKSFLWAVAALGDDGPGQLIDLYIDELRAALGQIGAQSPAEARNAKVLHPGRIEF